MVVVVGSTFSVGYTIFTNVGYTVFSSVDYTFFSVAAAERV